jgi:hypothetical protein
MNKCKKGKHLLLRTPTTEDLEPPQNTNTNNILVEEVDNPVTRVSANSSFKPTLYNSHVSVPGVRPMPMYQQ